MKTIFYKKTNQGGMLAIEIRDANINPLETQKNAIEHIKQKDEYREFESIFPEFEAASERYQAIVRRTKQHFECPDIKRLLIDLRGKQDKLISLQKEHEKENPIFLTPSNGLLVDTNTAEVIQNAMDAVYVMLNIDQDGKFIDFSVMPPESVGIKYRMRGCMEWRYTEYPDDIVPDSAMFENPDEQELEEIETARVSALPIELKRREKDLKLKSSIDTYLLACARADYLPSGEYANPEDEKKAANKKYKAEIKKIEQLYS